MPSKLEQLQLQFRQRIKEERLIKIHTDNQQKALSQVSKYSHSGATQSIAAPKPPNALSMQPQPHHSPVKKGSPGVDRSRPLPPLVASQSNSNSPVTGSSDYGSSRTIQNTRSKSVDIETKYASSGRNIAQNASRMPQNGRHPSFSQNDYSGRMDQTGENDNPSGRNVPQNASRMAQNGRQPSLSQNDNGGRIDSTDNPSGRNVPQNASRMAQNGRQPSLGIQNDNGNKMPPRNDSFSNSGTTSMNFARNGQNNRMPPSTESVQNVRMTVSRNDSVQNGKTSMRNGAGRTAASEPKSEATSDRRHDQELLNKMKQAELQRLKANSKNREDTSPRNGHTSTFSRPSNEARKTSKPPSPAPPANRPKPRTQAAPPTRRPANQPTPSTKTSPRSGPAKPSNAPPRKPPGPGQDQCTICGRNFNQDRIEKHVTICKKAASKKVKVFDATKMRTKGTEAEQFVKKGLVKADPKPSKKSDWRKKHNEFIEAIRQAKMVQQHLANGGKVSDLPPPKPSDTSDYVQCPHCNRKFNEGVAERHIPKCKNILSNKKPPPTRKK